jgi:hypothetical protein
MKTPHSFLDGAANFHSSLSSINLTRAEWTPFQTHYLLENLADRDSNPGPVDPYSGTLTTRPRLRFYIVTYHNIKPYTNTGLLKVQTQFSQQKRGFRNIKTKQPRGTTASNIYVHRVVDLCLFLLIIIIIIIEYFCIFSFS